MAYIWIFFDSCCLPALRENSARPSLTRTMEGRHRSADSLRPFVSESGHDRRRLRQTVSLRCSNCLAVTATAFSGRQFQSHPDQWTFLSSIRRIPTQKWKTPCAMPSAATRIIGVQHSVTDEDSAETRGHCRLRESKGQTHHRAAARKSAESLAAISYICRKGRITIRDVRSAASADGFSKPRILPRTGYAAFHI